MGRRLYSPVRRSEPWRRVVRVEDSRAAGFAVRMRRERSAPTASGHTGFVAVHPEVVWSVAQAAQPAVSPTARRPGG